MSVVAMRSRASFVLSIVALVQVLLLGATLGFLVLRLRDVRATVNRLGVEEQSLLIRLANAESELYRTSILLRDSIILDGGEQQRAHTELVDLLVRISDQKLEAPAWVTSAGMREEFSAVEALRREYLARARTVTAWRESERKALGAQYLSQQLAPTREKFIATVRDIAGLVRSLREAHNHAMADSIDRIETLLVRALSGAGAFGLALAGLAIWRFRRYEKEREVHTGRLQNAEERLRALSQRLVESQEFERKKVSRELHDEVGQILTALRVQLGQIDAAPGDSQSHLKQASELAERSLRSVREMAKGLRPAMLDDLGLAPALRWLGRDFSKNTVLDVDVQIEGELSDLGEAQRTCLYRVVQEALNNCAKHSKAQSARVLIHESPSEIVLTVQDAGVGFAPGGAGGIGLLGMRERVEELGGEFAVVTAPGSGTLIRTNLPKTRIETHCV